MKLTWVAALALIVGCSGKKDSDKTKEPPVPKPPTPAEEQACADDTAALGEWMKALVADGHVTVVASGVNLAKLPVGPSPITSAQVVTIKPEEIIIDGIMVATTTTRAAELIPAVMERVGPKPGTDVVFVIDEKVTWSTVAPVLAAAARGKHPRVSLVFAASAPGAAEPPPPSSIDADFAALAADAPNKAAKLAEGLAPDGGIPGKVFKDCAAVTKKLFPALAKVDNPSQADVAIAVGMPEEIKLCDCRVEMAAVRRLMWAWWGRDQGPALTAVKVDIAATAKDGTKVTTKPDAPWSEASQLVLAAAEQGKPIAPQ